MDALVLGGDFEGRAEWYISLLKDETLLELQENNFTGLSTLPNLSQNKREDWLPSMKRIIETGTPSERTAAIRNLVIIRDDDDEEILRILLPWLEDANWAKEADDERKELIEALKTVKISEAVPGLIAVLSNEKGEIRAAAAETIGEYDAPQAIPVLRAALHDKDEENEEEESRPKFIQALLKLKGFSADEQMSFLEAFAVYTVKQKAAEKAGNEDYSEVIPLEVFIGGFLKRQEEADEAVVQRVFDRIKILSRTNPLIANELSEILQGWKSRLIDLERLNLVKSGRADVETILRLLADRQELKKRIPAELSALRTSDGLPRGFFAAAAEDQSEIFTILKNSDDETRAFALAGARLLRLPIPVGDVAPHLSSQNKILALAAERFLETEDSLEARKLILAKYPNEVRILGARRMFKSVEEKDFQNYSEVLNRIFTSVNGTTYFAPDESDIIKFEKTLRDEVKQNPDLQTVFALVPNNSIGQKVVRVFKDKIIFTHYEDDARYRQRQLSPEEFEAFYRFLIDSQIDTYIPPGEARNNYLPGEFLMFSRAGGRRVAIQTLASVIKLSPFNKLYKIFDEFERRDLKVHYKLSDKLNGLDILFADDKFTARAVWKNGDDFRVLVEDNEKKKLVQEEIETAEKIESSDINADREQLRETQFRRRSQSLYKHFSWRKIEGNKISNIETPQPSEIFYLANSQFRIQYALPTDPAPHNRNRIANGFEYRTEGDYVSDILRVDASGAQLIVKKGSYRNPVVSPDGKWLVAHKRAGDAEKPVLINLLSGRETAINSVPTADTLQAQTFVASLGKFVIVRARYPYSNGKDNPDLKTPEFYLFDPNTGLAQITKGELRPLLQQTYRSLQPTGNPSEFWAAIYDDKNKSTQIGRYNDKTLTFRTVLEIPEIALGSMDFWIDEKEAKIYFVYQKQLLSLPLITSEK